MPDDEVSRTEEYVAPKRVTITDVARLAGVSTAAASKVLRNAYGVSPEMRAKVEGAIAALNYRPLAAARGMRGRTFTIGMMVPDITNPFVGLLADGVRDIVRSSDYDVLIGPAGITAASNQHVIESLTDRQMDGLILVSPLGTEEYLDSVGRATPTVVIGRHGPGDNYDTVAGDDIEGSRIVVDHLVSLGHRRISFVMHAESVDSDPRLPQNVRLEGYRQAMRAAGLTRYIDPIAATWTFDGGRHAAMNILSRSTGPTALHAGADIAALGVMTEFSLAGAAIPGQLSLCGYDNTHPSLEPLGLTSVDQSGRRLGELAATLLLERIGGRQVSEHVLITPRLIIRRTTSGLPPGVEPEG